MFRSSKRIVLFLFEKEFLIPDKIILNQFNETENYYFYPGYKKYISESNQVLIEFEISRYFNETIDSFTKKVPHW